MISNEKKLWEKLFKLHSEGQNLSSNISKYYDYWDGKYAAPKNSYFTDQTKTSCNIVKQIVESKLSATLDAQFSIGVVPKLNVFADIETIKDQNNYADILNDELRNILEENRIDDIKERICRWGLIAGMGVLQTTFNTSDKTEGKIELNVVPPKTLTWDKNAKDLKDLTFISYEIELNPSLAKKRYAVNQDGSVNEHLAKKIDELAEIKSDYSMNDTQQKGVVAIQSEQTSDLAYVYDSNGIVGGKVIDLIVMFLIDDSFYYPEKNDSENEKELKNEAKVKYPNGRLIVFSKNENKKLILEDRAAPEGFDNLANIDIFKPLDFDNICGKGEVEDLIPIQDRINGTYLKIRQLIATDINTLLYFKGTNFDLQDSDFVNHSVIGLEGTGGEGLPFVLSSESIPKAMQLVEYVTKLKEEAMEVARVNPTMINGIRQTGTTSAEQVEALQESPMGSIRTIQRNFKDMMICMGQKIITLIQKYYTVQRLVKLSTGIQIDEEKVVYAKFGEFEGQRYIDLLNEAAETVKQIKIDQNWEFNVEVVAGTEIPRSRRENAFLANKFVEMGILNLQDIDMLELYLKSLDIPNYRAYTTLMKHKKQKDESSPQPLRFIDIMKSPELATAFSELVKSLDTNSKAKGQLLASVGLIPEVDRLEDAPIQDVTSKSEIEDVATIAPDRVSGDPVKAAQAQEISSSIVTLEEANQ